MRMKRVVLALSGIILVGALGAMLAREWNRTRPHTAPFRSARTKSKSVVTLISKTRTSVPNTIAAKIVAGARAQRGDVYDAAYVTLEYPGGDVPRDRGACTDVVIRALRHAGYDLQRLIHEDMRRNFHLYPRKWGSRNTDRNIDHRRVLNQMRFFERHGWTLTRQVSPQTRADWQPGDIVCWKFDNGLDHCGILSDARNAVGFPLVIHNLGPCAEEDVLTAWKITGHYRYPKGKQSRYERPVSG